MRSSRWSSAISAGPSQDNEGWDLVEIDPAAARSYLATPGGSAVPLTGAPDAGRSYYREGVFLPDGDMFVNRVCCAGWPVRVTSSLLWEIDPTGHWLLYLSGRDLFLSLGGTEPFKLTSELIAAAWT